jgi:hypothetical protein
VRCGIALAGANQAGQITNALAEGGVLTGLEASLLNLQGTEPVILSAWDSRMGDVKIRERGHGKESTQGKSQPIGWNWSCAHGVCAVTPPYPLPIHTVG